VHTEYVVDLVAAQRVVGGRGSDHELAVELDFVEYERILQSGVRRTRHRRTTFL
jgi:hypothetical protein